MDPAIRVTNNQAQVRKRITALFVRRSGNGQSEPAVSNTHASLLIHEGVHPKKISERLGHSSIKLTLDTYGHLFEGGDRDSAEKMERRCKRRNVPIRRRPVHAREVPADGVQTARNSWVSTRRRIAGRDGGLLARIPRSPRPRSRSDLSQMSTSRGFRSDSLIPPNRRNHGLFGVVAIILPCSERHAG